MNSNENVVTLYGMSLELVLIKTEVHADTDGRSRTVGCERGPPLWDMSRAVM